jgi:hypothetical protein
MGVRLLALHIKGITETGVKVSENRVQRMFGCKRVKVTGGRRKLENELYNLYPSLHTIRMIKTRRMRWLGHVACIHMGLIKNA